MAEAKFTVDATVRGYHIYHDVRDAVGEQLLCERELSNYHDPFAVAIVKSLVTVGHVPRKISSICSMFLRRGGCIHCRVTGRRRYSADLPQGGLEIPCILIFKGPIQDVEKAKKLVKCALQCFIKPSYNKFSANYQ